MVSPRKSSIRGRRRAPLRSEKTGVLSTSASKGGGVRWRVAVEPSPSFDPVVLAEHIGNTVLARHFEAIRKGLMPQGGRQKPLTKPTTEDDARRYHQGRLALEGRRPDVRGYTGDTTRPFSDNLVRTKLKTSGRRVRIKRTVSALGMLLPSNGSGTRVKASIQADPIHAGWLETEFKRGVYYFSVRGRVSRLVDKAAAQWLGVGIAGALRAGRKRERKAKNASRR